MASGLGLRRISLQVAVHEQPVLAMRVRRAWPRIGQAVWKWSNWHSPARDRRSPAQRRIDRRAHRATRRALSVDRYLRGRRRKLPALPHLEILGGQRCAREASLSAHSTDAPAAFRRIDPRDTRRPTIKHANRTAAKGPVIAQLQRAYHTGIPRPVQRRKQKEAPRWGRGT